MHLMHLKEGFVLHLHFCCLPSLTRKHGDSLIAKNLLFVFINISSDIISEKCLAIYTEKTSKCLPGIFLKAFSQLNPNTPPTHYFLGVFHKHAL